MRRNSVYSAYGVKTAVNIDFRGQHFGDFPTRCINYKHTYIAILLKRQFKSVRSKIWHCHWHRRARILIKGQRLFYQHRFSQWFVYSFVCVHRNILYIASALKTAFSILYSDRDVLLGWQNCWWHGKRLRNFYVFLQRMRRECYIGDFVQKSDMRFAHATSISYNTGIFSLL